MRHYRVIAGLLKNNRDCVRRNATWQAIHEETGAGRLVGREYHFSDSDKEKLRRYAKALSGVDPLVESTDGSRIDVASKFSNEKLSSWSVFGTLVNVVTLGNSVIASRMGPASTPDCVIQSLRPDDIDVSALAGQRLIVVENGEVLSHIKPALLPEEWQDTLVMYRGHGENVRHVQQFIDQHPEDRLAVFYDFDPAGLSMALSQPGKVVIPREWQSLAGRDDFRTLNRRKVFRAQHKQLQQLLVSGPNDFWALILSYMNDHQVAVMQEHMVARGIPLDVI